MNVVDVDVFTMLQENYTAGVVSENKAYSTLSCQISMYSSTVVCHFYTVRGRVNNILTCKTSSSKYKLHFPQCNWTAYLRNSHRFKTPHFQQVVQVFLLWTSNLSSVIKLPIRATEGSIQVIILILSNTQYFRQGSLDLLVSPIKKLF